MGAQAVIEKDGEGERQADAGTPYGGYWLAWNVSRVDSQFFPNLPKELLSIIKVIIYDFMHDQTNDRMEDKNASINNSNG